MFGYLRFLLALLVLLSHVNLRLGRDFNPGVFAVVMFYMLAGFVSAHLIEKVFTEKQQLFDFYLDRILRIYPQYLFVALLSVLFLAVTAYGEPQYRFGTVLNNILIIPLNYYESIDSSILQALPYPYPLIPPAWSLALELQAYILLPFAARSVVARASLGVTSFLIFLMANLGVINPEDYGYRLLVGVLFVFLLGISIHHCLRSSSYLHRFDYFFPIVVLITLLGLFPVLLTSPEIIFANFVRETILGVLLGIPLLFCLGKIKVKLLGNRLFGDLSYGIFLSHFLAMWFLNSNGLELQLIGSGPYIAMTISLSVGIAICGVFGVERAMKQYRFSRTRKSTSD